MTATVLAPYLKQRFVDANGAALYLGTVATFAAGTNTPIVTYKDSTGGATNTNPITLNPRGECDLYLIPNVAYKITVADQFGNLIWTVDNVVNSALLTLYGGVDTGSANTYILNFTASFTAYADGIIIYWIPANTNTGASTINVNGLGVVNIVNPDGSSLSPKQILANQPAQILFKAGVFELITPAIVAVGSFTPVWSGFSVPPSGFVFYRRSGNIVALTFSASVGTSNAVSFGLGSLPAVIGTSLPQTVSIPGLIDNGSTVTTFSTAGIATTTISFFKDTTSTNNWTATGNKGFLGNSTLVYSV